SQPSPEPWRPVPAPLAPSGPAHQLPAPARCLQKPHRPYSDQPAAFKNSITRIRSQLAGSKYEASASPTQPAAFKNSITRIRSQLAGSKCEASASPTQPAVFENPNARIVSQPAAF